MHTPVHSGTGFVLACSSYVQQHLRSFYFFLFFPNNRRHCCCVRSSLSSQVIHIHAYIQQQQSSTASIDRSIEPAATTANKIRNKSFSSLDDWLWLILLLVDSVTTPDVQSPVSSPVCCSFVCVFVCPPSAISSVYYVSVCLSCVFSFQYLLSAVQQ